MMLIMIHRNAQNALVVLLSLYLSDLIRSIKSIAVTIANPPMTKGYNGELIRMRKSIVIMVIVAESVGATSMSINNLFFIFISLVSVSQTICPKLPES